MMTTAEEPRDDPNSAWREDALRATAQAARQCLESASFEALFEIDAEDRIRSDEGWTRAFGIAPPEPATLDLLEARMHPAHREGWRDALAQHRAEDVPLEFELSLAHVERGWIRHRCRAVSRRDLDGRARRTFLACLDISIEAQREEAEAALALRVQTLEAELKAARERPLLPPPRASIRPAETASATQRVTRARQEALGKALEKARSMAETPSFDTEGLRRALVESQGILDAIPEASTPREDAMRAFRQLKGLHEDLGLTALNAQLEALRLGAQGAGLAAVAGQMKQLARATATSTDTFENALRKLRQEEDRRTRTAKRVKALLEAAAENLVGDEERKQREVKLRAALAEARGLIEAEDAG